MDSKVSRCLNELSVQLKGFLRSNLTKHHKRYPKIFLLIKKQGPIEPINQGIDFMLFSPF